MAKPNFFLIGASKSGTSTIYDTIASHPEVLVGRPKEIGFFAADSVFARGTEWYESHFTPTANETAIGDGSGRHSMSTLYPKAAERIAQYRQDAKIIFIVRHPMERIPSYWIQKLTQGDPVEADFNRAVRINRAHFVDTSKYWTEISLYRRYFPDERILVLFFEDLLNHPNALIARILKFLELDASHVPAGGERKLGATRGKKIDTTRLQVLRSLPLYEKVRGFFPKALRASVKERFFRRTISDKPRWDPRTRDWVVAEIGDDIKAFLAFYGKPADYWIL